jgi:hypothetical protein
MTKDEALEKKAENARELGLNYEPEQEPCGGCGGSGWVPHDPDIGTSQECFVCGGSGAYPKEPEPYKVISDHITQAIGGRAYVDPVTGNVSVGTPQRTWIGLTDEDLANCSGHEVRWVLYWDKLLKEKNHV